LQSFSSHGSEPQMNPLRVPEHGSGQ
jgi:hypothetical protein